MTKTMHTIAVWLPEWCWNAQTIVNPLSPVGLWVYLFK